MQKEITAEKSKWGYQIKQKVVTTGNEQNNEPVSRRSQLILRFVPFPWLLLFETVTGRHMYYVFTYIYSLLIEKDLCECQSMSVKFLCAFSFYSFQSDTSLFFGKRFPFLFLFCAIPTLVLSLPTWSSSYLDWSWGNEPMTCPLDEILIRWLRSRTVVAWSK